MLHRLGPIAIAAVVLMVGCADEDQRPTLGDEAPPIEATSSTQEPFEGGGDGDTTTVGDPSSSSIVSDSGGGAGTTVSG